MDQSIVDGLMAEHQKMLDEYNKAREEFSKKGKEIIRSSFKAFFEANPKIKAITWTQYTPFFNDGDPCEFSVYDMWVLSEESYEAWMDEGGSYAEEFDVASRYVDDRWKSVLTDDEKKTIRTFVDSIHKLPDEVFEDMFGDHVYVVATADGFEVEEHSHD